MCNALKTMLYRINYAINSLCAFMFWHLSLCVSISISLTFINYCISCDTIQWSQQCFAHFIYTEYDAIFISLIQIFRIVCMAWKTAFGFCMCMLFIVLSSGLYCKRIFRNWHWTATSKRICDTFATFLIIV